jgi:hypothetical protein
MAETPSHEMGSREDTLDGSSMGAKLAVNAGAAEAVTIQDARQHVKIDSRPCRGSSAVSESQKPRCSQLVIREMDANAVPAALLTKALVS